MTYAIRSLDTGAWFEKTKAYTVNQKADIYQASIQRAMVFRKLKDAQAKCAELYHCEVVPVKVSRTGWPPVAGIEYTSVLPSY